MLDRLVTHFEEFIHRQTTRGMILLVTSVVAVVLANSPFRDTYLHLTHAPVAFRVGGMALQMSWLHLCVMLTPALFYWSLNHSGEFGRGWEIPMATDIAFSVSALVILGRRIPWPSSSPSFKPSPSTCLHWGGPLSSLPSSSPST